ncbi:MAG: glycosyltransferase [Ignavibacteriae bacterium]|nr:glycosyltransferase [Ignavibacteriota bacterium]
MFEIIFIIIVASYFLQAILVTIGIQKKFPKLSEENLPTATVIVAARNEEENILECLVSLEALEFPQNKLDIILVDDYSTDSTNKIIAEYISDKPFFKLIQPTKDFGETRGKARAIANGIEFAKGEIILTTDADCTVSKMWAKTLASYYTEGVAVVCGYTNQNWKNIFEGMQDFDFIYLLTVAAGTINWGKPMSAMGNNMSYRKSAYNEFGGYSKIPFSVTEDFKLLMAIKDLKKYKIIYPLDKESLVTSKPCNDAKTLYRQKKRWAVGGTGSSLDGFFVIASAFIVTVFTLAVPFFYSATVMYVLLFKIFTDLFMLKNVFDTLAIKFNLKNFIAFEFYITFYFVIIALVVLFDKNVVWKERNY